MLSNPSQQNRVTEELQLEEMMTNSYQHQSQNSRYKKQNDELKETVKQHCLRINQLQLQNKEYKKKNAQLKEVNQNLTQIYQECLITIGSQIRGNASKQNLRQKSLLKLDLQTIKANVIEKQEQFLNTIAKLEKIVHDKEVERQLLVQNMSAKQQALRIEVVSYNNLIEEKTEQIDKFASYFKQLQSILQIESKQLNFDLVKVKVEVGILENKKMAQRLQQKEIHIETLKHTIRIFNQ